MTLTNKERIQIGVITIVLIFGIIRVVTLKNRNRTAENISPIQNLTALTSVPSTGASSSINLTPDRAAQLSRIKQRWGRDPFFGLPIEGGSFHEPTSDDQPSGELVLSGISLKGNHAMAIVNRTIVREGDEAFGMRVLAIERDRVVFAKNSHEVILRIGTSQ